jgi:hypothetical protein
MSLFQSVRDLFARPNDVIVRRQNGMTIYETPSKYSYELCADMLEKYVHPKIINKIKEVVEKGPNSSFTYSSTIGHTYDEILDEKTIVADKNLHINGSQSADGYEYSLVFWIETVHRIQ